MSPNHTACPLDDTVRRHDGDLYRQGRGPEAGLTYRMADTERNVAEIQAWKSRIELDLHGEPGKPGTGLLAKMESWDTILKFLKTSIPILIAIGTLVFAALMWDIARHQASPKSMLFSDQPVVAQSQDATVPSR